MGTETSVYVHIPFCKHRCSYCDFNTYAGLEWYRPAYVRSLCAEIRFVAQSAPGYLPVHSIFFGGGTPSLLAAGEVEMVLKNIFDSFDVSSEVEISLEANPGTLSLPYLRDLRRLGVNRLSMGMQSAHPDDLRLLERQHDHSDVIQSIKWARQADISNLSLDLMFGLPEQSLDRWKSTLERAVELNCEHLSLYALTLEHGTPFQHWTDRGLIPEADDDLSADMYEYTLERLDRSGMIQYEISNWARRDGNGDLLTCRHNLQYWHNRSYLGFGAGAHGFSGGYRTANVLGIPAYIRRMDTDKAVMDQNHLVYPASPAAVTVSPIDMWTEIQETMMVGLRLTQEGVSNHAFIQRFGRPLDEIFGSEIRDLVRKGLLEWAGDEQANLRLTPKGRLLGNQVFMRFVGLEKR